MGYDDDYDDDKTVYGFPGNDEGSRHLPEDEVWLVVVNTGQRFLIPDGSRKRIGRGKDQDIQVADPEKRISRQHLILSRNGQEIETEITGGNGIVVNGQHFAKGKRVVEFPPFRIEFGDIVMDLDIDLTVTQNFPPKTAEPSTTWGRRAEGRRHTSSADNREAGASPPNYGRRAEDGCNGPSSDNRGAATTASPPHYDRRANDRWNGPPAPEHQGNGYNRRPPQNYPTHPMPQREAEKPPFNQNQPDYSSKGFSHSNHFTPASTNLHPEHPSFQGGSVSDGFADSQQFEPVPVGGDDSPKRIKAPRNTLALGIGALFALLLMVSVLYFLWPKASVETFPAPTTANPRPNNPTAIPPPQATSDYDQLMINRAELNIETGNYEDATYYLSRIPEDSPLSHKVSDLNEKIQRLEGTKQ